MARRPAGNFASGILLLTFRPFNVGDVVTTGGESGSKTKARELQDRLLAHGVRLFAVTMPMRYDVGLTYVRPGSGADDTVQKEHTEFLTAVKASNGKFLRLAPKRRSNQWGFKYTDDERMALATSLQVLYFQMAKYYRLELAPVRAVDQHASLKVELNPPDRIKARKPQLTHPSKVHPCRAGD